MNKPVKDVKKDKPKICNPATYPEEARNTAILRQLSK